MDIIDNNINGGFDEKRRNTTRSRIRKTPAEAVGDIFIYGILIILSILFIFPLYQVLISSISDPRIVIQKRGILWFPTDVQIEAYKIVFANRNIKIGFYNTIIYMILGTAFQYLITILSAYTLSKENLKLKKGIVIYFIITMYFGGGLIPYYLLLNNIGLINNRLALIIPYGVNVWNIIIMKTHFQSIPKSLKEAAYIDGANDFWILFRVMVPLSGAVSAVLILYCAVSYWNMWFEPMIFINERSKYPLQSMLREILIDDQQVMAGAGRTKIRPGISQTHFFKTQVKYANIIISTVPILVLYPFLQKYFVKGVMLGSLKE